MHGGGFYNMVKYLVAPARMPDELTWFKWEAYATWISGFALIVAIYYAGASLYLDRPGRAGHLRRPRGIAISLPASCSAGSSTTGCAARRSAATTRCSAAVGFVFIVALAFAFTQVFSAAAPSCRSAR